MPDSRIRQLERDAAQGDANARVQLLQERMRAGAVSRSRMRLAAYLGHPDARAALGEEAPDEVPALHDWVEGLKRWGKDPGVRAAVACGRLVLPGWKSSHPDDALAQRCIDVARDWIDCPCPDHAEAAKEAAGALLDGFDWLDHREVFSVLALFESVAMSAHSKNPHSAWVLSAAKLAALVTSDDVVRRSISDAIVPWALGEGAAASQ